MKTKTILGMAGIAAIAVTAIVTIFSVNANTTSEMSELMIKNLEALSQGEQARGVDYVSTITRELKATYIKNGYLVECKVHETDTLCIGSGSISCTSGVTYGAPFDCTGGGPVYAR